MIRFNTEENRKKLKEIEKFKTRPLKEIYIKICELIKEIIEFDPPFKVKELKTDRDLIECIQEGYSMLYCITHGIDYKTFDVTKYMGNNNFFDWIAEYKFNHFKKEILSDLGMELVDTVSDGIIVKDKEKTSQFIN